MKVNQRTKGKRVQKKKNKSFNITHIVAAIFIAYFAYTFFDQQLKLNKYNSQIAMYKQEIESKENLVEYYNNRSENIASDEYIESVAREKLGLVKPYETIYVDGNK